MRALWSVVAAVGLAACHSRSPGPGVAPPVVKKDCPEPLPEMVAKLTAHQAELNAQLASALGLDAGPDEAPLQVGTAAVSDIQRRAAQLYLQAYEAENRDPALAITLYGQVMRMLPPSDAAAPQAKKRHDALVAASGGARRGN